MSFLQRICWIVLLTVTYACNSSNKIPNDVFSPEAMSDIFLELAMAEAFIENYQSKDTTLRRDSLIAVEMDKILSIRKADDKKFVRSYQFYKSHPNLFKVLMDTAYSKAQRRRDTATNGKTPPVRL